MEVSSIMEEILHYSFCLSLKEMILCLVIVFHIGYFFGTLEAGVKSDVKENIEENIVLALTYGSDMTVSEKGEKEHHSEPIRENSIKSNLESSLPISELSETEKPIQPRLIHSNSQPEPLPAHQPQEESNLSREFLSEKISVEGRKIQSRGIFHMTFEKATNPKFLRKIEKHEIITDYEIPEVEGKDGNMLQLMPFAGGRKSFELTDDSSILEIITYENSRLQKFPTLQKRLIKTNEFSIFPTAESSINSATSNLEQKPYLPITPSLCENGKFTKFFKNQRKIGEGAFGTVYQVMNIFEGKEYAVKKLFINLKNQMSTEKMELVLNESIKEVSILSQYSHPNIVRFYTCWLEIANLNESIAFNKFHYAPLSSASLRSSLMDENDSVQMLSDSRISFKKKKSRQELESCVEVSYVSSIGEDSGFAFEREEESADPEIRDDFGGESNCQVVSACGDNNLPNTNNTKIAHSFAPIFALYIQMELCKEGSLDSYLLRRQYVNRTFSFLIIHQLLKGVQYLHSQGLVHRDLKPGNILLNKKEKLIKIGDFGLSVRMNEKIEYGKVGTPSYIAPEIIEKRLIKKEDLPLIDVYSIGVIYFELLNLFNFTTKHEKLQKINQLKFGTIDLHNDFKPEKKLIKLMTKSTSRIPIKEIFEKKEYKELLQLMETDKSLMESWDDIDGLSEVRSEI